MEHPRPTPGSDPEREARLRRGLRAHPELLARFESILGLREVAEGALRTADESEGQLVQEVRRLGNEVMQGWAVQRHRATGGARYAQSFRRLPAKGPARLIAEAEGTMICTLAAGRGRGEPRPRQWKEMRLVAAQAHGGSRVHYGATFGAVGEVAQRWGHGTKDAGLALESRIPVGADGAEWIGRQSREVFGDQARVLTDFFHVSEYLSAAAEVGRSKAPRHWLHLQQKRLKRGDVKAVLEALAPSLEPATVTDESAPVRAAHRYLANRIEALDYPTALAQELPISSGLIESGHKHVLHARLKGPGTAWLPAHADAIAQLRVLRSNPLRDDFWSAPLCPSSSKHHN